MKKNKFTEHGQALILIALAIVGLVGFAALAIDGGRVFSDRRHSQNASDTSVLAAALARVRPATATDWTMIALSRAAANGYSAADGITQVDVDVCSNLPRTTADGYRMVCKGLKSTDDPTQFVYVHIKSIVKLFFAPVIGWRTITNHTDAVAHASPSVPTPWFDGYGIASVHEGCSSPGDGNPFEVAGNSENYVVGSGVLVNASCPTEASFVQNGSSSSLDVSTTICVHGTANNNALSGTDISSSTTPAIQQGCAPISPSTYQLPDDPTCDREGGIDDLGGGVWLAWPGYYTDNAPFPNVSGGAATVILTKGIYCLYHGMDVNAQTTLTTDWNRNGVFDPAVEGVLFYLPGTAADDDITFNGGANIHIHAVSSKPASWTDDKWVNMLIYIKPSPGYDPDIDISGNAGSTFTGTILAPSAHVVLGGTNSTDAGTVTLDSQIIADTVKLTGTTDFTLVYNESNNAITMTNPNLAMIE